MISATSSLRTGHLNCRSDAASANIEKLKGVEQIRCCGLSLRHVDPDGGSMVHLWLSRGNDRDKERGLEPIVVQRNRTGVRGAWASAEWFSYM